MLDMIAAMLGKVPPAQLGSMLSPMLNQIGDYLRLLATDHAAQVPPGADVRAEIFSRLDAQGAGHTLVSFRVTWKDDSRQADRLSVPLLDGAGKPFTMPIGELLMLLLDKK